MLSLGVGALQLMLDRGGDADWFSAVEIWIELGLAITGFWVFTVHLLTSDNPFIDPKIFVDRNFATGLVFIFVIGIILLASLALLPPMLSTIFGYPTITTGIVMAPRGVGTMISMLVVGRIVRIVDARLLVVTGLLLTAQSLYTMSGFTPQMDNYLIITLGRDPGAGARTGVRAAVDRGLRHARCALPHRRHGLFSLVRNIGSSIGISIVTVMLTRNTQINHAELSATITPFDPTLQAVSPARRGGRPDGAVADRRPRQPAGADDLLRRRLQADDAGDAVRHSAGVPAAQAEGRSRLRRPPPRIWTDQPTGQRSISWRSAGSKARRRSS